MRGFALVIVAALMATWGAVLIPSAQADTAPIGTLPATVSVDALPTTQVNGVVWSQVTVGNTVYATGSFTSARPAGSPKGTNETVRKNLLAYDITTGNLITSFNHTLNAQGMVVAASPDGSTIYVGGDFTSTDGVTRGHIVAFSTATGAIIKTFAPALNGRVKAIAATNTTVYVGGSFTAVGGATRTRLAAFAASSGALLNWAPSADDNEVDAMVLSPAGKVIVGGRFSTLNGTQALGLGALDPTSGATLAWAANQQVQDSGANAGITSLTTDDKQVYGSGFVFGPGGNLEGSFAADPETGAINWIEDCHGDSYDTFATGQTLYVVSHSHFCGNIGAYPQTNPWGFQRATAYSTYPTGTVAHNSIGGYFDWYGNPAPTQLDWYPTLTTGTYTGQSQAAWSVTGNASYIALGGEFPTVNGASQQGLTRFAVRALAPNKAGPRPAATLTPSVVSLSAGTLRVAWQSTWDQDNQTLTYKVVRDGKTATPVYTTTQNSRFWERPAMGFIDSGLVAGSTHTYRVYVTDPFGNQTTGSTVTATVGNAVPSQYVTDVQTDGATSFWRLGESSGTTGYDWAGYNDLLEQSGVGHSADGAIMGDPNTASTFDGTANGTASSQSATPGPDTFTAEAWFKTTSTSGGKILGFGSAATGTSTSYDRHIYLDNAGHLIFGVYNGAVSTVSSTATYNDGVYHQVAASLSPSGMVLYVDGKRIATRTNVTGGQPYTGYWRVGGDNLNGWTSQPSSNNLAATIDDVAIYPTALNLAQIQQHFVDSGRSLNLPATPTDALGKAVLADSPDLYWRLDDAAGPTAVDQTGNSAGGVYQGGISYATPSAVTPNGTAVTLDGSTGLIVNPTPTTNPTVYSEELWFNTTTTSGGKLIGFGNASSGESSSYDRHVYMLNTGQLRFGTYTGVTNTATSTASYNDGAWHQLVATQGPAGMVLYVDGTSVATNPQTQAQAYTGYWRVGGDHTWGGTSSDFFSGSIDEVAVYPTQLSAGQVQAHYSASAVNAGKQPTAAFTSSCTYLACSYDASSSSDPTGNVTSYSWDFGDGTTANTATPQHTYPAAGTYTATLTVTDDQGFVSAAASKTVTVAANQAPTAAFAATCTNLGCAFDGTASTDADGSVTGYAWDFGDGTTGTGATASHTYAAGGTYTATLTVTDDQGLASSPATKTVSVIAPNTALATDTFNRTVSNGLGSADKGGAWTTVGTASNLSVSPGAGSLLTPAPGGQASAYLPGVSSTSAETDLTVSLNQAPTSTGAYLYVTGRRISTNNEYRARVRVAGSKVYVGLYKLAGSSTATLIGTETQVAGLTYTPGMALAIRFQVQGTGTTGLNLKVWQASSAEPASWNITGTDSTPGLQAAGSVGLTSYLSSSASNTSLVASVGSFSVISLG